MRFRRGSISVALIALLLAVGTAVAASPTLTASPSSSPSAGAGTNAPGHSAKPSQASEASELPESSNAPESPEASGAAPSAAELARVVADLKAAGITATADQLQALAAKVGLGGAVRVLVIANASNKTPDEILAMFEGGKGWGQIIKDLGLSINPGIGGIMSQGHGQGHGNGHRPNPSATPS